MRKRIRIIWVLVWVAAAVCGGRSDGARVQFDFGNWTSSHAFAGWNSIGAGQANQNGFLLSGALDSNDIPTSVNLRMVDAFLSSPVRITYSAAPYGASSTAFSPARPDATGYNWYIYQDDTDHSVSIRIEGLTVGQTYNFTFYASCSGVDARRVGKYIIGSQSVTLDPGNNVNNTVTISNVSPDSNGYVTINLDFGADVSVPDRMCLLGVLAIDGTFGMSAADTTTFQYYTNLFGWYSGLTPANRTTVTNGTQVTGILSPYTAITRQGDNFTLTTSTCRFSSSVFPDSINILGDEVLSSPITLDTGATGTVGALSITATGQEVDLGQTITYPQYNLNIQNQLLYDGLMIVTLNFSASSPATISKAELQIPLPQTIGKYARYENFGHPSNFKFGFGPIPQPGETVTVKYSLLNGQMPNGWNPTTSANQDAVFWQWQNNGFLPSFWIGNEEKGLGWASESDNGWHYNSTDTLVMMERKSGAIVAHVYFITNPLTINGTRQIQFLLQVTPPKPFPTDWCTLEMNPYDPSTFVPQYQSLTDAQKQVPVGDPATSGNLASDYFTLWSVGCGSPDVVDPAAFLLGIQASHYYGYEPLPYLNLTSLALNSKDGYYYGVRTREWAQKPYTSYIDGTTPINSIVNTCMRSFCAPWLAWRIGYMIDQDNISGIYFDNCAVYKCTNAAHGCGYVDDNGTYQPTIPFLAARNFFMMTRNQFLTRSKRPYIFCHAGDYPAEISFTDFHLTGEGFYGLDAIANITLGEMRAMMIGRQQQSGSLRVFLPQMTYDPNYNPVDEAPVRRLLALTLIHGTKIWPVFCNKTQILNSWTVLRNLKGNPVTFVPYWKWTAANQTLNANNVYATLYSSQSSKGVLAVSNLSTSSQVVQIPKTALQAYIPGVNIATDPMDNQTVALDQDNLTLTVGAKDFRLILLQGQAAITGHVQPGGYSGDLQDLGVKVQLRQNGVVARTDRMLLNSTGQFSLANVTPGTYEVAVKVGGWLEKVLTGVSVIQTPTDLGTIPLNGGDRDGDNAVTSSDLSIVLANMDAIGNQ